MLRNNAHARRCADAHISSLGYLWSESWRHKKLSGTVWTQRLSHFTNCRLLGVCDSRFSHVYRAKLPHFILSTFSMNETHTSRISDVKKINLKTAQLYRQSYFWLFGARERTSGRGARMHNARKSRMLAFCWWLKWRHGGWAVRALGL